MSGKPRTKIEASMRETKKKAKERASSFKRQVAAYQATNQPKRVIGSTISATNPGALLTIKSVKTFPPQILSSSKAANKTRDLLGQEVAAAEARMIRSGTIAPILMRRNTKDNINYGGPKQVNVSITNTSQAAPGRTRKISGQGKKKRRRTRKKRKRRKTRKRTQKKTPKRA